MDFSAAFEAYLKNELGVFRPDAVLDAQEIGDGNINYVFRVTDPMEGRSLILKCAGRIPRFSGAYRLSLLRGRNEAAYLRLQGERLGPCLPKLYGYNRRLRLLVMEDLRDGYPLLRDALEDETLLRQLPERLSDFTARACFFTSDLYLPHTKKKDLERRFANPSLCALTEKLVFSDPYLLPPTVSTKENAALFAGILQKDSALPEAAAALKFRFMNAPQALIHGDLHFGSVFAGKDRCVVFDPEFCFFGPIGYDLGNLIAHFLLESRVAEERGNSLQGARLTETMLQTVEAFEMRFLRLAKEQSTDPMLRQGTFAESFTASILADAAGFAGTEILRRVLGVAKIPSLTGCPAAERIAAERTLVRDGAALLRRGQELRSAAAYADFFAGCHS